MDTLRNLGLFFNRYLAQIIVILLGILIVKVGTEVDVLPTGEELRQNKFFLYGGIALIVAGTISILYVADIINRIAHMTLLFAVLPVSIILFAYMDYRSIKSEIEFQNLVKLHRTEAIQRLKDLRDAQVEYKTVHNRYAATFDSLRIFVKEGKSPIVSRKGDVPQTLSPEQYKALGYKDPPKTMISETEAWKLAQMGLLDGFERDTTYITVMDKLFSSDKSKIARDSRYPFNPDSLEIVPVTGGKMEFIMETGFVDKDGVKMPVLFIKEPNPLTKDTLMVGSLTDVTTNGNWGE